MDEKNKGQGWCKHCGKVVVGEIKSNSDADVLRCKRCQREVPVICRLESSIKAKILSSENT